MKYIKLYEDFVTEKAYQLSGIYGAKGIAERSHLHLKKKLNVFSMMEALNQH